MNDWENPSCVNTLSAALAETGRFEEAIQRVEQSERLDKSGELNQINQTMLAAFKAHQPYREPTMH